MVAARSLGDIGGDHPKAGDVVGDRTIIRITDKFVLYGLRKGERENCGAYVTDLREWFDYERSVKLAATTNLTVDM